MRPYILAETNWKAVRDKRFDVAILPWGATEAHNLHLPYGTDIIEAEAFAAESARLAWERGVKAIVLPPVPFGVNTGQADILLDINMNPGTQMMILHDLITVLNRQRIFRLIILNSHGGNDFKNMIRELGLKFPEMFLCQCAGYLAADQKQFFENKDDHAGEMETSLLLYLRPDLVLPLKEAGPGKGKKFVFRGIQEGWAWAERKWSQVTEDTGIGDPSKASAEKGKKFFEAVTKNISEFIVEVATTPPNKRYV